MRHRAFVVLAVLLVLVSPATLAGTPEDPEIEDPPEDAVHYEFKHQEPSLDVTKVWFTWDSGTLQVHLLVADADPFGSEGTQDPGDAGTRYDVYWTMDDENYVARVGFCTARPEADCQIPEGEPVFLAGQSMQIERQLVWDAGADIHGELNQTAGGVAETGSPAHLRIDVAPALVGNPGPGSVLEAPAFSTYVDHHNPGSGTSDGPNHHHPGHVDANDESGSDYRIPAGEASSDGDTGNATAEGIEDTSQIPSIPLALLLVVGIIVATATRRRSG